MSHAESEKSSAEHKLGRPRKGAQFTTPFPPRQGYEQSAEGIVNRALRQSLRGPQSLMERAVADAAVTWLNVGTKQGIVPVGVERLHEIALDWQRLPHLHRHSIDAIRCEDSGPVGWRAQVSASDGAQWEVALLLDRREGCCLIRIWQEPGEGLLVQVTIQPRSADQTELVACLFVADHAAQDLGQLSQQWSAVAGLFWEADSAMMVERQRQIDKRVDVGPDRQRDLGLRDRLALPLPFELGGREFILADVDGQLVAFPRRCPHQLGPLEHALEGRVLTCPWHGYRFDAVTGEDLSGGVCRLSGMPDVRCSGGRVIVSAPRSG
jgi:nitrite reductase/ring-hydroxylating ferredoxin subunit